jgi:hypothetical protein
MMMDRVIHKTLKERLNYVSKSSSSITIYIFDLFAQLQMSFALIGHRIDDLVLVIYILTGSRFKEFA